MKLTFRVRYTREEDQHAYNWCAEIQQVGPPRRKHGPPTEIGPIHHVWALTRWGIKLEAKRKCKRLKKGTPRGRPKIYEYTVEV